MLARVAVLCWLAAKPVSSEVAAKVSHYYWLNQGRLGNLLFQYVAILDLTTKNDRVYSFHNDVFELVDVDPRFVLLAKRSRWARSISFRVDRMIRWAKQRGFVGSVYVEPAEHLGDFPVESTDVVRRRGSIRSFFAIEGFFQQGSYRNSLINLKGGLEARARTLLASVVPAGVTVAVHIRMSDYKDWIVYGIKDASISEQWYRERIDDFRRRFDQPAFVVFSDDIAAVKQLRLGDDVSYFHGSVIDDFTVMAACDHLIMSPSTFAWWAAFLFWEPGKVLMAPLYWAGFKSQRWYPPGICTDGVEYFPVSAAAE